MPDEPEASNVDPNAKAEPARGRSTIEFPYLDLSNGIEVAHAVKAVGGTAADMTQLAVKLQMAPEGGGFRLRMMAAKMFGILEYQRGQVDLTELGIRIVDAQYERAAKVEAFMRVQLFKALYDKLAGQTLPPPAAIERMAEQAGVAPKQKDKARQVFIRSAKQAGMFDLSPDRLAMPPSTNGSPGAGKPQIDGNPPPPPPPPPSLDLHPFIKGLLDKLPQADSEWGLKDRAKWLTTAANIFDLMYTAADDSMTIEIEVNKVGGSP